MTEKKPGSKNTKTDQKRFGVGGTRTNDSRTGKLEIRTVSPRMLIVCEGRKTEPNYFKSFKVTNDIYGKGLETLRVVEEAERLNEEKGPFDQIWCVFDRDSFPADDFDNAIARIHSLAGKGFRAAYSNEAFELWYILHFRYLDSALNRSAYAHLLDDHLGCKYRKGDAQIYSLLQDEGDEVVAMRNAQRLRDHHSSDIPCSSCNPVTTVDQLVQTLREIQRLRGL